MRKQSSPARRERLELGLLHGSDMFQMYSTTGVGAACTADAGDMHTTGAGAT